MQVMSMMTTTDQRVGLCRAIVGAVEHADEETKRRLARDLDEADFCARSDRELWQMAVAYRVRFADLVRVRRMPSRIRDVRQELYLCWKCRDQRWVMIPGDPDERFERCENCNPEGSA